MTRQGHKNERNWSKVTAKSQNVNTRPGYNSLIGQISQCNRKVLKTRRGLSIFEDQKTQDQINENSKIPIFKDE